MSHAPGVTPRSRWDYDPHAVGHRTLLARSCTDCGELKLGRFFQKGSNGYRNRQCAACHGRDYRENMDGRQAARKRERDRVANAKMNQRTRSTARRNGYVWTGPELEIIATRDDLTIGALAVALGRTYAAVSHARRKVRTKPSREDLLAGASSDA